MTTRKLVEEHEAELLTAVRFFWSVLPSESKAGSRALGRSLASTGVEKGVAELKKLFDNPELNFATLSWRMEVMRRVAEETDRELVEELMQFVDDPLKAANFRFSQPMLQTFVMRLDVLAAGMKIVRTLIVREIRQ